MGATERPVPTLLSLFRRATRMMVDDLLGRMDAAGYPGITPSEHLVFEAIPPDGARLTELAQQIGITHQSAGELVGSLERRGLLERRPDPADRRARLVALTDDGRELVRAALHEIAEIERGWTTRLAELGVDGDLRAALRDVTGPPPGRGPADG